VTTKFFSNLEISKLLRSVAAALSLTDQDQFRVVAYERAADAIEHSSSETKDLWDENRLTDLPGVGIGIAKYLHELFTTGKVAHFQSVLKQFPPAMFELMSVPGIGPKNAFKLCKSLGISKAHTAISQLRKAAHKNRISGLPGFGSESQARILAALDELEHRTQRHLLHQATTVAESVLSYLHRSPHVQSASVLGSLRRQASTVGDIDIAVATDHPQQVMTHFSNYPYKTRVLESGEKSTSLLLPGGFQVDLMVQPPTAFGSLLQHFTGSKHHNIALREHALKQGLSLSEYGIKNLKTGRTAIFSDEKSFYSYLKLDYIPPELREGENEIAAALDHHLPKLVELSDIKGDLHVHSNFPIEPSHDLGSSTIAELVKTAHALHYQYIGLADHNPALSTHTPTKVIDLLKKRQHEINCEKRSIKVFNALEVDILPDGKLAVADQALDLLDYAIVSIHSSFRQSRQVATKRVLAALSHPKAKILGHPTARLLNQREGVNLDWEQIFDFCLHHAKWLEIDAWPNRLDLPDNLVKQAVGKGLTVIIDSDSHSAQDLSYMRYGVSVARRGWATPDRVANTLDLRAIIDQLS